MKKLVFTGLAAASVIGFSSVALAGVQDLTVANDTGLTISELYLSELTNDDWEEDVLGEDVLPDGDSTKVTFNNYEEGECSFDIKIVDSQDEAWTVEGINLCQTSKVTFHREGDKITYTEETD